MKKHVLDCGMGEYYANGMRGRISVLLMYLYLASEFDLG